MAAQQRKLGKYENVNAAIHPGGAFVSEGKHLPGRVEIAHARVVDPSGLRAAHLQRGKHQQAMVNIAKDPLEREYRYGRIDRLQHAAGRRYRDVLAWAAGRGDPGGYDARAGVSRDSGEYRIAKIMDAAREAVAIKAEARELTGARGEMVLSGVLGDELSFREMAFKIGSEPGAPTFWKKQAGVSRVARQFREALTLLSSAWFEGKA